MSGSRMIGFYRGSESSSSSSSSSSVSSSQVESRVDCFSLTVIFSFGKCRNEPEKENEV